MQQRGCKKVFTTGKRSFAVRSALCRAHFFGRTANRTFVVRIFSGARQKKRSVKKLFAVRFYLGARQTNSLLCAFLWRTTNIFSPAIKSVSLFVVFAVQCCKTHGKRISLPCAKEKHGTHISLPRVLPQRAAKYF
jgi:hypothetical protein